MRLHPSRELSFDPAFDDELILRMLAGARLAETTQLSKGFFVEPSVLEEQIETGQNDDDENLTYRFGGSSYWNVNADGHLITSDGHLVSGETMDADQVPEFHLFLSATNELQLPVSRTDRNFRKGAAIGMRSKLKKCTTFAVITAVQYNVFGPKYSGLRRTGNRYLIGYIPDAVGDQPRQLTLSHEIFNPLSGHRRMTLGRYLFAPSCEMLDPGKKRKNARIFMGELALEHDKRRVQEMLSAFSWSKIKVSNGNPLFLD